MSTLKDTNGKEFTTYEVAKDDYPELEGRIVKYIYESGREVSGIVVGCNRSVGFTLVDVNDKNKYLICFRGPVTSNPSDFTGAECTYNDMFNALVTSVKSGTMCPRDLLTLQEGEDYIPGPCAGNCAYKQ